MPYRSLLGAILLMALALPAGQVLADNATYPDWKGQWTRFIVPGLPWPTVARRDQAMGIWPASAPHA
jgi:hypothetical protein